MRILVIGGTGFIGRYVVRELAGMGHAITVFHRGRTGGTPPPGIGSLIGSRSDLPQFRAAFERLAPEAVLDMILPNGRDAEALMQTFRGIAGRVVAVSSIDVYRACGVLHRREPGALEPLPLTEDSALRTVLNPYGPEVIRNVQKVYPWVTGDYDKIPVEHAVLSVPELPGTVLRLPMVYGPGDPGHRLFPILKRIADGRRVILLEECAARWRGSRGYVEDVAHALALAAVESRAAGRVYNVAEPEALSELEWTRQVAAAAGWDGEITVLPAHRAPAHLKHTANLEQHWVADSTRIRTELGYRERVPRDRALGEAVAWERAHPPAEIDPGHFDYAAEDAALLGRAAARNR